MIDHTAIEALAKAQAITAANEAAARSATLVALPNDFQIHDLEAFQLMRRRQRGTMTTTTLEDFAQYLASYIEPGAAVFIDQPKMAATAVLNLGTTAAPGHADHRAVLQLQQTAAFKALASTASGRGLTQTEAAEFLEDWAPLVACSKGEEIIDTIKAVGALRNITIEGLRKVQATESQLSATRSALESVSASSGSGHPLPTEITFITEPYLGLPARRFKLRLSVLTGDKPQITLRIQNAEQHQQDMAAELATLVRQAVQAQCPVIQGSYVTGK